ncbi:MAG: hypothetical protein NTV86_18660 [Planctomycetota bacterium]|nr:hypothetical protein [Planctomycetota bacterium]
MDAADPVTACGVLRRLPGETFYPVLDYCGCGEARLLLYHDSTSAGVPIRIWELDSRQLTVIENQMLER